MGTRAHGRSIAPRAPFRQGLRAPARDSSDTDARVVAKPSELDLSDGPARASRLFLIDGNSLAYRAYYALPEELATTDGFPTNALLGFANMLMRLLTDYQPRGRDRGLGHAARAPARALPGLQGLAQADARRCSSSSSRTCARSSRRSATATSSSRATRPTT